MRDEGDDYGGAGIAEEAGWRQVRDYCRRFGRGRLLEPFLAGKPTVTVLASPAPPNDSKAKIRFSQDDNRDDELSNRSSVRPVSKYNTSIDSQQEEDMKEVDDSSLDNSNISQDEDCTQNADLTTSRKLEWDSLADIGYEQEKEFNNQLSTIERVVLQRRNKTNIILASNIGENSKVVGEISMNSPSAQSTPIITLSYSKVLKSPKDNNKYKNRLIIKRKAKNRITCPCPCPRKKFGEPTLDTKKNVPSNMDIHQPFKVHGDTLKANIIPIEHKRRELLAKDDNELSDDLSKTPITLNVSQLNKKPSTYVIKRKMPKISFKQSANVQQTNVAEKKVTPKFQDVGMNTHLDKNLDESVINESLLTTANSFEFVPGHMLNVDDNSSNENDEEIIEDGKASSDEECLLQYTETDPMCSNHMSNQDVISSSHSSDVPSNRNIVLSDTSSFSDTELISALVNLRHKDPFLRDRLKKKIADLLSSTEHLNSGGHSSGSYVSNKYKVPKTEEYINKSDVLYLKTDNHSPVTQKETSKREVFVQTVSDMGTNTNTNILNENDKIIEHNAKINTNINRDINILGAPSLELSSDDQTRSSDYSTETQSRIKKIDEKISHLLMLKLDLKNNKYKSKNEIKRNNDSTKNTLNSSMCASSSIKTTTLRRDSNVDSQNLVVPPLNIKSSSEESINYDENTKNSSDVSKRSKDHSKKSKISSASSQSLAINTDTKQSTNESDPLAKESHESEKRKTYQNINDKQTTHSVPLCKYSSENPSSLCSCYGSNFFKSSSTPTTNKEICNAIFKLQKIDKLFSRYNNCKVMKAFLADYEDLVKKYHSKKTSAIKSKLDENSVHQSVEIPSTEENKNIGTSTSVTLKTNYNSLSEKKIISYDEVKSIEENKNNGINTSATVKTNDNSLSEKKIISSDEVKSIDEHISSHPSLPNSKSVKQGLQNTDQILNEIIILMKKFESQLQVLEKNAPKIDSTTQIPSSGFSHSSSTKENTDNKTVHSSDQNIKHIDIVKPSCKDISTMTAVSPVNIEDKSPTSSAISIKMKNENKPLISTTQKQSSNESSTVKSKSTNHKYVKEVKKPNKKTIYCTNEDITLKCACQKLVKKCKSCQKKDLETRICQILQSNIVRKNYPNPIAYNLILQPSDSILNDTSEQHQRKPLEQVIMKVPNDKKKASKNVNGALRQKTNSISEHCSCYEHSQCDCCGISTDEQLKEFSSLNDEHSSFQKTNSSENSNTILTDSSPTDEVPKNSLTKITTLTLQEYLKKNKPYSFNRMYQRQEILKELNKLRNQKNQNLRKLLISAVSKYPNIKNISESDLNKLIDGDHLNIFLPEIKGLFDNKQVIKETAFRYKKLPEVKSKKEAFKKQVYMKSNKLLAELFVKKLQQRTLKGIVNISQSSDVISL